MSTLDLLRELQARGVVLRSQDHRLFYKPREAVCSKLRAAMAQRKDEILRWLSCPPEARLHAENPHLPGPNAGERVSTPRGNGRVVAVLPEFIAVQLDRQPAGDLDRFLTFEIFSLEVQHDARE